MASLTSPDWRGFLRRAPLPAGSAPANSMPPNEGRFSWYSRQQAAPLPAVPHPAPVPAAPPASQPAVWWPTIWPPQTIPPPRPNAGRDAGAASAPPQPHRRDVGASGTQRPRPISPRARRCLEWVVAALPEQQRAEVISALVKTLRFRAGNDQPCSLDPTQPIGRERFGRAGETLTPEGTVTVREWLDDEVREILRTFERRLSRTRRNYYLAMHSARLGQLWRELENRFEIDVLEEVKAALARRWV